MWCWRGTGEWSIGDNGDGEIGLISNVMLIGSVIGVMGCGWVSDWDRVQDLGGLNCCPWL